MFSIKNTIIQPIPQKESLGSLTFSSSDGSFSNQNTFGTRPYNAENPYNPIYHSTVWSLQLPSNSTHAWVGLETTRDDNTSITVKTPECPVASDSKSYPFSFYKIYSDGSSAVTSTFAKVTSGAPVYSITLIDQITSSTVNNSLNLPALSYKFPDNRVIQYIPPICNYASPELTSSSIFWGGKLISALENQHFFCKNIYIQTIRNTSYLKIEFQMIYGTNSSSFPEGEGIIFMYK
jgi:hypothetical protein